MKKRDYENYEEYLKHQKKKTSCPKRRARLQSRFDIRKEKFIKRFSRFKESGIIGNNKSVLCLGSRMGEEVAAFQSYNLDCIGIDLIPNLPYVIEGDFHNLEFDDSSRDLIYTNSLDHTLNLDKFLSEATRVLKDGGYFILDFYPGNFNEFESIKIDSVTEIQNESPDSLKLIEEYKYKDQLYDLREVQLVFQKESADG